MNTTSKRVMTFVLTAFVAVSLSACSNMSKRDKNISVGIGAVGGVSLLVVAH